MLNQYMNKTPNYNAKVKAILDATQPGERTCALTGRKWDMSVEEIERYKHFNVPPSKYHPLTRMHILAGFFVGYQWWNNKSSEDGTPFLTPAHPGSGIKVVPDKQWFDHDYSSTSRDDDGRGVFEIMEELVHEIPITGQRNLVPPVNSISTISAGDENSYFMNASRAKNTLFGMNALNVENSAEIYQSFGVNNSYNVVHSDRIFNCRWVQESRDCMNSMFLFDCRNCEDCFMATNKRNAKFVFKNKQLSESEYRVQMERTALTCRSSFEPLRDEFLQMVERDAIWPENFNEKADGCTGEYLTDCTDCKECYFHHNCRNQFQSSFSFDESEGNMSCTGWFGATNSYYSTTGSRSSNVKYCYTQIQCQNMEYSYHCYNCEDCFGCVGLNRKRFHIFNKEYSEEGYWRVVDELKCRILDDGTYGEFMPVSWSPTRFMDSGATLFFLAEEKDAVSLASSMYSAESSGACGEDRVSADQLRKTEDIPDCLDNPAFDEWIGKPVFDEGVERRFTFLPQEIKFYRAMKIAPPNQHFIARVRNLGYRANSGAFTEGSCDKCGKNLLIAKNKIFPNRRVYCRKDYLDFIEHTA